MLYLDNKYTKWYYKIIAEAYASGDRYVDKMYRNKYYERHHIIPKSMGGGDLYPNLVLLTAKEHFIVHALLYRMTTGQDKSKMGHAWKLMRFSSTGQRYFNSRLYKATKVNLTKSKETRKKISKSHIGKKRTYESRKKQSDTRTGAPLSEYQLIQVTKGNQGKNRGRKHNKEYAQAISDRNSKSFIAISPQGNITLGKNIYKFAEEYNFPFSTLHQCCRKKRYRIHKGVASGWAIFYSLLFSQNLV